MGAKRELKFALERYWSATASRASKDGVDALLTCASSLRARHWKLQHDAGVSIIPSNDFALYDQMLDLAVLLGAVPSQYRAINDAVKQHVDGASVHPLAGTLETMFAMARGIQITLNGCALDLPALEMKKWFSQNYHYIVPELNGQTSKFELNKDYVKPVLEYNEAKALGYRTKPVLIGPITFLMLSNVDHRSALLVKDQTLDKVLDAMLPVYVEVLLQLQSAGAELIQLDEPALVLDLPACAKKLYNKAYDYIYKHLNQANSDVRSKLLVATYFDDLAPEWLDVLLSLPVDGVHVDLVSVPKQGSALVAALNNDKHARSLSVLSLGVVDGRNIWKTNIQSTLTALRSVVDQIQVPLDTVIVSSSCSLLHVPHSLSLESQLKPEMLSWLSFAQEKLGEIVALARSVSSDPTISALLESNAADALSRLHSPLIHDPAVKKRVEDVDDSMLKRQSPFAVRIVQQQAAIGLPLFPTTTIGSFPQTAEVRSWRAALKSGKLSADDYMQKVKEETVRCIQLQEKLGIDVLVDGEFDRVDMVEYFGQHLNGFMFTQYGWVQSYGSRMVKPPIIYGDVSRPHPMTVEISKFAQSYTSKPVKGMLTGPVTILQWSFVRDDQPRSLTAQQIALAIRDEVSDLDHAGLRVIQIDEPAIREGLPLRSSKRADYLQWSVDAFLLSSTGVADSTQIHTHMCYSNFEDMLADIVRMDADVLTIENARSDVKLLSHFTRSAYPNHCGPGMYDIHSPRVPSLDELRARIKLLQAYIMPEQLWVNPDCGLKTRGWPEVEQALQNLVTVALEARKAK